MKKEKNIKVDLYRVKGDAAPFVLVDYMDKDAEEHNGVMILDSGCMGNILSHEMADSVAPLCKMEEEGTRLYSIAHEVTEAENVNFSFAFGGVQFHETFCINDHRLPHIKGDLPLVGILGNKFMLKHRLVIDYRDFTIHNSNANPENLAVSGCDLFVPMGYGLVNYGIPLLAMTQGENQIFSMADTGASFNIIAKQTITDNGFECQYLGVSDSISGLGASETEAEDAMVKYKIATMKDGDGSLDEISYNSQFKVISHYPYTPSQGSCDKNGTPLLPVEAIISSPFMAKEGWVLDFGADIVYKRKSAAMLREAV